MSEFLQRLRELIHEHDILISDHGYDQLAEDGISTREVIAGIHQAVIVEEYPNYPKGLCILVLQKDRAGKPIHVVWGIPKGYYKPAVLVTRNDNRKLTTRDNVIFQR